MSMHTPEPAQVQPQAAAPITNSNTVVVNGHGGAYGPIKTVGMAYLFWALLGLVGGHHFYLGQTGKGVLYLLTGGLLGIGWLVDAVTLGGQVRRANALRGYRGF